MDANAAANADSDGPSAGKAKAPVKQPPLQDREHKRKRDAAGEDDAHLLDQMVRAVEEALHRLGREEGANAGGGGKFPNLSHARRTAPPATFSRESEPRRFVRFVKEQRQKKKMTSPIQPKRGPRSQQVPPDQKGEESAEEVKSIVSGAMDRLEAYWSKRREVFGDDRAYLPLAQQRTEARGAGTGAGCAGTSALSAQDSWAMTGGGTATASGSQTSWRWSYLPPRSESSPPAFFVDCSSSDAVALGGDDDNDDEGATLRRLFYLLSAVACSCESSRTEGVSLIVFLPEDGNPDAAGNCVESFLGLLLGAMPAKLRGLHFVVVSDETEMEEMLLSYLLEYLGGSEDVKEKTSVIAGPTPAAVCRKLVESSSGGFERDHLPTQVGGSWTVENMQAWYSNTADEEERELSEMKRHARAGVAASGALVSTGTTHVMDNKSDDASSDRTKNVSIADDSTGSAKAPPPSSSSSTTSSAQVAAAVVAAAVARVAAAAQSAPPSAASLKSRDDSDKAEEEKDNQDHEEEDPQEKEEGGESRKAFLRKRNALYARRKYARRKIETEVLQDQCLHLEEQNHYLRLEGKRLEILIGNANQIVTLWDGMSKRAPELKAPPPTAAASHQQTVKPQSQPVPREVVAPSLVANAGGTSASGGFADLGALLSAVSGSPMSPQVSSLAIAIAALSQQQKRQPNPASSERPKDALALISGSSTTQQQQQQQQQARSGQPQPALSHQGQSPLTLVQMPQNVLASGNQFQRQQQQQQQHAGGSSISAKQEPADGLASLLQGLANFSNNHQQQQSQHAGSSPANNETLLSSALAAAASSLLPLNRRQQQHLEQGSSPMPAASNSQANVTWDILQEIIMAAQAKQQRAPPQQQQQQAPSLTHILQQLQQQQRQQPRQQRQMPLEQAYRHQQQEQQQQQQSRQQAQMPPQQSYRYQQQEQQRQQSRQQGQMLPQQGYQYQQEQQQQQQTQSNSPNPGAVSLIQQLLQQLTDPKNNR